VAIGQRELRSCRSQMPTGPPTRNEFLPISMPIVGNGRDCMAGAPFYIRPIPAALAGSRELG
jgi:hypothetical protein